MNLKSDQTRFSIQFRQPLNGYALLAEPTPGDRKNKHRDICSPLINPYDRPGFFNPLTIRQVKWIARLYPVLKDRDTDLLAQRALEYASLEKAIKATRTYPDKAQDSWWLWFGDAILYRAMTGGDESPLKKCIKHMKWQTTRDIAELKLIFKKLFAISLNDDAFRREDK